MEGEGSIVDAAVVASSSSVQRRSIDGAGVKGLYACRGVGPSRASSAWSLKRGGSEHGCRNRCKGTFKRLPLSWICGLGELFFGMGESKLHNKN